MSNRAIRQHIWVQTDRVTHIQWEIYDDDDDTQPTQESTQLFETALKQILHMLNDPKTKAIALKSNPPSFSH